MLGGYKKEVEMKKGFTLIELLIVVIVVAVLASFAVPQYMRVVEKTKGGKAKNALALLAQAEKLYRADNDTYIALVMNMADATLGDYMELVSVDNDLEWNYATTVAGAAAFTLSAERTAGPYATQIITLDQDGVWDDSAFMP